MDEGDNRFIDDGEDGLIWPDKPEPLTEKQKKYRDALIEARETGKSFTQALRERGIDEKWVGET